MHWLLSISKLVCGLTLFGEMRLPVSASTGAVSAVKRRSRRGGGSLGRFTLAEELDVGDVGE
jgi:hypothetical protein